MDREFVERQGLDEPVPAVDTPEPVSAVQVLQWQRSAGNAAVARLLQRDKKSAALLTTLATPHVGEGPAIEVQQHLVAELEKLIKETKWEVEEPTELNLGGILVDGLPDAGRTYKTNDKADVDRLFKRLAGAQFVDLPPQVPGAKSTGTHFGAHVKAAGLGPDVIENTLKTMLDAQQFEYLRLAGLPNDEWKILVELHYIRARPKEMAGFHKDTRGQSLFVNLNYHVPGHQVRGPEYVLNPPPSQKHDEQIYGTQGKAGSLPSAFTQDLSKTRKALPQPTTIDSAGAMDGMGYVSFVDEAVHHATPWFGHRNITGPEFKTYLETNHKAEFDEITRATQVHKAKRLHVRSLAHYVDKAIIPKRDITKWTKWLSMSTVQPPTKFTRQDFATTMQAGEFDHMLDDIGSDKHARRAHAGPGGWSQANIYNAPNAPIRPDAVPPLIRTASDPDLTKDWPEQLPEEVPRRFIRSWVRAVPASLADQLRD